MSRVLLLMPTSTYKATDFLRAAERLGVDVIVGTDRRQALERQAPGRTLALDLHEAGPSVQRIVELHARTPVDAVVGTDDESTVLAAAAAAALGLPHNPPEAVRAARDKHETRRRLAAAGLSGPRFRQVPIGAPAERVAGEIDYPCVLKPLTLSASRGVLRADDARGFVRAFRRIARILADPELRRRGERTDAVLVEDYLPGAELAVEGLLDAGTLRILALFDKPDPLEGPVFEETLYVTPSRRPVAEQSAIAGEVAAGCRALGLVEGPVHAEVRVHEGRPRLLEVAPRTIGGLCSRTLRFGLGVSLEELVLARALGGDPTPWNREDGAAGVLMLPTPRRGVLRAVRGLEAARALAGIEQITLTAHRGSELIPLPEGHRYLGFVFARAATAEEVERALRLAGRSLEILVDPAPGDAQKPGLGDG